VAVGDLVFAVTAYGSAFAIRSTIHLPWVSDMLPAHRFFEVSHPWILMPWSLWVCLYGVTLYEPPYKRGAAELVTSVTLGLGLQTALIAGSYFFLQKPFPRSVLALYWALAAGGITAWRLLIAKLNGLLPQRRVLLINTASEDLLATARLQESLGDEFKIIGSHHVQEGHDLSEIARSRKVDGLILLTEPSLYGRLLSTANLASHSVWLLPFVSKSSYERPLLVTDHSASWKGIFDLGLALLLAVLTAPLTIIAGVLILIGSGSPVFYRQERVGQGGRLFWLYKFRTMVRGAERETGAVLSNMNDPRVTRAGRWLRRFRIDELPQLFNIISGDMSFVGPRPERPEFVDRFLKEIPAYRERLRAKPGLTGLAQVAGTYHTSADEKLKYDLAYVYSRSPLLDALVLVKTVRVLLARQGV